MYKSILLHNFAENSLIFDARIKFIKDRGKLWKQSKRGKCDYTTNLKSLSRTLHSSMIIELAIILNLLLIECNCSNVKVQEMFLWNEVLSDPLRLVASSKKHRTRKYIYRYIYRILKEIYRTLISFIASKRVHFGVFWSANTEHEI